jgi:hypothetical protein
MIDTLPDNAIRLFLSNVLEGSGKGKAVPLKVKQSRYRPGIAQRVPGIKVTRFLVVYYSGMFYLFLARDRSRDCPFNLHSGGCYARGFTGCIPLGAAASRYNNMCCQSSCAFRCQLKLKVNLPDKEPSASQQDSLYLPEYY